MKKEQILTEEEWFEYFSPEQVRRRKDAAFEERQRKLKESKERKEALYKAKSDQIKKTEEVLIEQGLIGDDSNIALLLSAFADLQPRQRTKCLSALSDLCVWDM